jgi:hypothetical protein
VSDDPTHDEAAEPLRRLFAAALADEPPIRVTPLSVQAQARSGRRPHRNWQRGFRAVGAGAAAIAVLGGLVFVIANSTSTESSNSASSMASSAMAAATTGAAGFAAGDASSAEASSAEAGAAGSAAPQNVRPPASSPAQASAVSSAGSSSAAATTSASSVSASSASAASDAAACPSTTPAQQAAARAAGWTVAPIPPGDRASLCGDGVTGMVLTRAGATVAVLVRPVTGGHGLHAGDRLGWAHSATGTEVAVVPLPGRDPGTTAAEANALAAAVLAAR